MVNNQLKMMISSKIDFIHNMNCILHDVSFKNILLFLIGYFITSETSMQIRERAFAFLVLLLSVKSNNNNL
jgi:hypothetical protein